MSRPPKTTYKTTNWKSYNQALRQRGSLTVWFDPSMQWEAIPSGRRGRQQAYSDAAIQACLTLKTLLGLPLRQGVPLFAIGPRTMARGFVASLLELSGPGWSVPDFSTLSRRQKTLNVTIPYRGSKGPLHLLVDS
ncbi:transposase, partial [Paracoccus sp. JM45]|uniref:transposase n=1 Tax=Paracoccus sp. JM45 TaxID=2283626 RepID=UPI000ED1AD98